jgi:hypothetical protein
MPDGELKFTRPFVKDMTLEVVFKRATESGTAKSGSGAELPISEVRFCAALGRQSRRVFLVPVLPLLTDAVDKVGDERGEAPDWSVLTVTFRIGRSRRPHRVCGVDADDDAGRDHGITRRIRRTSRRF